MNIELENKLYERFDFYKKNNEPTLIGGFECGDGWFNLIWELSENIEKELNNLCINKNSFEVLQVKQKYGELRYYINRYIKEIDILIDNATDKSLTICEECGQPGKPVGDNWIEVMCDNCLRKQGGII